MKKTCFYALTSLITSLLLFSCGGEKLVPTCDGSNPVYDNEIETILFANCSSTSSCHGEGASKRKGEYITYEQFKVSLDDGSFQKDVFEKQNMPKKSVLLQQDIDLIQCWVDNGYPEN